MIDDFEQDTEKQVGSFIGDSSLGALVDLAFNILIIVLAFSTFAVAESEKENEKQIERAFEETVAGTCVAASPYAFRKALRGLGGRIFIVKIGIKNQLKYELLENPGTGELKAVAMNYKEKRQVRHLDVEHWKLSRKEIGFLNYRGRLRKKEVIYAFLPKKKLQAIRDGHNPEKEKCVLWHIEPYMLLRAN